MPLGKEVGLGPGHIVLDGDPVRTQPAQQLLSTFWPMSIVAKRSPILATAELLLFSGHCVCCKFHRNPSRFCNHVGRNLAIPITLVIGFHTRSILYYRIAMI